MSTENQNCIINSPGMFFTFASCLLPNTEESTGQTLTLTSFILQPCNSKPIATREGAQLQLRT